MWDPAAVMVQNVVSTSDLNMDDSSSNVENNLENLRILEVHSENTEAEKHCDKDTSSNKPTEDSIPGNADIDEVSRARLVKGDLAEFIISFILFVF